jgi:cytochrome c oxidase subunit 2
VAKRPASRLALALITAAPGANQNVLDPASGPAHEITRLWWVMLIGAAIGFGSILLLLFLGWSRRNRPGLPGGSTSERAETGLVVLLGVVVPMVALLSLFVYADVFVMRSTAAPRPGSTELTIDVVGHQWFWEARYAGTRVVTANEIHIPVVTRENLVGTTADVIHSVWLPALNRKVDLIPGRENRILLDADRPGRFRGQCSEFCGLQHAHMAVEVVAEPPVQFRAWLANQERDAREPATAEQRDGKALFLAQACSGCHTIRGTAASGSAGPDLTHVASRRMLAALTIPNEPSDLRDWIENPQHAKPGVKMPALPLTRQQVDELAAYLESLR